MARASTATLLSLDRYAAMMGISPLHFNGAITPGLDPQIFPQSGCDGVWWQYDWQNYQQTSREHLAEMIALAEEELAEKMGYYAAPMWIAERVKFSEIYDTNLRQSWFNSRGVVQSLNLTYKKVRALGRRLATLVATASVAAAPPAPPPTDLIVYSDADGDGFIEKATITINPWPAAITDLRSVKLYFPGHSGEPEWEIRPITKSLAGGILTITCKSWLMIDPDLWEVYPTSEVIEPIDVTDDTHFITSVEVYQETVDPTLAPLVFGWVEGNCANPPCSGETQDGCGVILDGTSGIVRGYPASYDAATGTWPSATLVRTASMPDYVDVYYLAGDVSLNYERGQAVDPLSLRWAETIMWLATSRLDRPLCECGRSGAVAEKLMENMAESTDASRYTMSLETLNNPFGTRYGEYLAWLRVGKSSRRVLGSAVI